MSDEGGGPSAFSDGILDLLGHVEVRRAESDADKERIYRLRYVSYLRERAVGPAIEERLSDRFDRLPNTRSFGLYIDGALASSLRLSVSTATCQDLPASGVFPDILGPMLAAGKTVLDPTRFVVSDLHARLYPKLPYATIRVAWLASEHYGVDVALATVRSEHQAFYKRIFNHRLVCAARPYPSLLKPISLMAMNFAEERDRGLKRYPFLRSTEAERAALFEDVPARPESAPARRVAC